MRVLGRAKAFQEPWHYLRNTVLAMLASMQKKKTREMERGCYKWKSDEDDLVFGFFFFFEREKQVLMIIFGDKFDKNFYNETF